MMLVIITTVLVFRSSKISLKILLSNLSMLQQKKYYNTRFSGPSSFFVNTIIYNMIIINIL